MVKKTEFDNKSSSANAAKTQNVSSARNVALMMFAGAVLDISWQMAVVVLVPIIGGFELDKHFQTTPALTIIGFLLAMAGTFAVIKKALANYGSRTVDHPKGAK